MDAGLPFRSDLAAFVPGVGFRVVVVGDCQCAIDDRPAVGKDGDLIGPRPGDCPRAPGLDPALFAFWPVAAGAALSATPATGGADLAAVPGPAAGLLLLSAVLALALARPVARAACAFGDWFTAERGTGPGQNGWV